MTQPPTTRPQGPPCRPTATLRPSHPAATSNCLQWRSADAVIHGIPCKRAAHLNTPQVAVNRPACQGQASLHQLRVNPGALGGLAFRLSHDLRIQRTSRAPSHPAVGVPNVTEANALRTKCRIEGAVHEIALRLPFQNRRGNTECATKQSKACTPYPCQRSRDPSSLGIRVPTGYRLRFRSTAGQWSCGCPKRVPRAHVPQAGAKRKRAGVWRPARLKTGCGDRI